MTTFLIIRHGYSKSNEQGYFTGQTDVPLATLGKAQADQTARFLFVNYKIDCLYSSPLSRAYDTAAPIAKLFNLPILIEEDVKEINGGEWEGKTPERLLYLYKEAYSLWLSDIGVARCTSGESMQEVQIRAVNALKKFAKRHEGQTVAITTHAGVIRALQCVWQKLPLSQMKTIPWVANASISVVRCDGENFFLETLANVEHLQN